MFHYPHGDLHELNLDWLLEQWKKFKEGFSNTFTATSQTVSPNSDPAVSVNYDSDTGIYDFHFELPDSGVPTSTSIGYQAGTSPTTPPTGTWLANPPIVPEGQYLWVKNRVEYNTGYYFSFYAVARQGISGNPVYHFQIPFTAGTTFTYSNAYITSDMHVVQAFLADLDSATSNISWATSNGAITFTGIFTKASTLDVYLTKCS